MSATPGLRERKKEQTRRTIADAANRLFQERGFDAVTVAEIAREADVSEVTVFNHFPTKEDLFYAGMQFFEEGLLAAVSERPTGESVLAAFKRVIQEGFPRLGLEETAGSIQAAATMIGSSRALQQREREVIAAYTRRLAEILAAQRGVEPDDVEVVAVAGALMAAHRGLVAWVRNAVMAGTRGPRLVQEAEAQAERVFTRLENGITTFG